jgi:hypothetical protein
MTLYLRVAVGKATYLLPAAQVTHVAPADESGAADTAITRIDCRQLFDESADTPGHRISLAGEGDLIVDRVDGLTELADDNFRPLPAIGRFGALIDAVSLPVANEPPALRLKINARAFVEMLSAVPAE